MDKFLGLVLVVISMYFRVFLKVYVQNVDIFGVAKISKVFFFGMPRHFRGKQWMLGQSLRKKKNESTPTPFRDSTSEFSNYIFNVFVLWKKPFLQII